MATPSKKPCKFGDKCTRKDTDCWFYHPNSAADAPTVPSTKQTSTKACRDGNKCTRFDCWFSHPLKTPQLPVEDVILSNEELSARNPAFAAALAAGMQLDEEDMTNLAVLDLEVQLADIDLDVEVAHEEGN
jgi:hypothetical protein